MKLIVLCTILFSFQLHAEPDKDGVFDFNGQAEVTTSRAYYQDNTEYEHSCSRGADVCGYAPVSSQTCDNSTPQRCWTTTTSEYRCSPGAQTCTTSWESGRAGYYTEEAIVTFLNPEFKVQETPFKFKVVNNKSAIVPDVVPKGILIGVNEIINNASRSKRFDVKFFTLKEFQTTALESVVKASFEKKTKTMSIVIKGKLKRDDKINMSITGSYSLLARRTLLQNFSGTLRDLRALLTENENGTMTISFVVDLGTASSLKLSLGTDPAFPEGFTLFGEKEKAQISQTLKVRKF